MFVDKAIGRTTMFDPDDAMRLDDWNVFKSTLPHQFGEMSKRNWGHPWHSLCSYQGKLKPAIAHTLVKALMPSSSGRMLDPFSGVGSIPFEARLANHVAFGFDISPAAAVISRAKLEKIDQSDIDSELDELAEFLKDPKFCSDNSFLDKIRFNGPLPSYFHPTTLEEILAVREFYSGSRSKRASSALVMSAMMHILHGNRPYALSRRSHPITPFAPTGPVEYRAVMPRLREKVRRASETIPRSDLPSGKSFFHDATTLWPLEVDNLDAIITSPPFFDSTRFHTANWMRLWFAGWEIEDFRVKPAMFVDEMQKKTFGVYNSIFEQASLRLKKNGIFALHLGKSKKCDMASMLSVIGSRYLSLIDSFTESVEHCESHGIRDKGTVTHHQYLLFMRV